MAIRYLNTDLDVLNPNDLKGLADALKVRGMLVLHLERDADGVWRATFESDAQCSDPDANIAQMCAALEGLPGPHRDTWRASTLREFNIGYACGQEPHSFDQGLSLATLRRIVDLGAALRLTLYRSEDACAG